MKDFFGQVAVVTGGSSGIGLAVARQLVSGGASVGLVARGRERLEEAAAELQKLRAAGRRSTSCRRT